MNDEIPRLLAGERLDRVVAMLAGVSRADAAQLVAAGAVRLDGVTHASGKVKVAEGQRIEIDAAVVSGPALPVAEPDIEVSVVHVDDAVIVVDKAEGVVVHPGSGHRSGTLVNALLARFPELAEVGEPARPGIVHRLDKGTSGLLVVARTPAAYESLVAQLADHSAGREYLALVWGEPEAPSGVIDAPIGRSARTPTRMAVSTTGKRARSRYEVVRAFHHPASVSLVRCRLETGRTHQIRVHLAAIGHPVVGDATYRGNRSGVTVRRPMLHAAQLSFVHPVTGDRATFTAPIPADMQAVLDGLEA